MNEVAGYKLNHVYRRANLIYKVTEIFNETNVPFEEYDWAVTSQYKDGRIITHHAPRWDDLEIPQECFNSCENVTNCFHCMRRINYELTKEE